MNSRLVRSKVARYLSVAVLPLAVAGGISAAAAEENAGGPRYTYFDTGYKWTDVLYAVEQPGGTHKGVQLNGSLGLAKVGPVGIQVFGQFFDGNFDGSTVEFDDGELGTITCSDSRDSQAVAGGLGAYLPIAEKTNFELRAGYIDITKFQTPNNLCQLVSASDTGYFGEAMIRSEMSENVELEVGFRYSELSDSNIANNDVLLGFGYHVTDYLTLRATGIVFDTDTGFELSARLYFGEFLGRDTIF